MTHSAVIEVLLIAIAILLFGIYQHGERRRKDEEQRRWAAHQAAKREREAREAAELRRWEKEQREAEAAEAARKAAELREIAAENARIVREDEYQREREEAELRADPLLTAEELAAWHECEFWDNYDRRGGSPPAYQNQAQYYESIGYKPRNAIRQVIKGKLTRAARAQL
jgi:hypothetical protein